MTEKEVLQAAGLIKARDEINKLIKRAEKEIDLSVGLFDGEGTVYDTDVAIPQQIITLGLHRMAEECARQIMLLMSPT